MVEHLLRKQEVAGSIPVVGFSQRVSFAPFREKISDAGTRTRVARVRAEYPNQLDYIGARAILWAGGSVQTKEVLGSFVQGVDKCSVWRTSSTSGSWCSGITFALHAKGPGFKSQRVHLFFHALDFAKFGLHHGACL